MELLCDKIVLLFFSFFFQSSGTTSNTPTSLGIQLMGGANVTRKGEPGIFVANVKRGSAAEGKLFPGDKILAVL